VTVPRSLAALLGLATAALAVPSGCDDDATAADGGVGHEAGPDIGPPLEGGAGADGAHTGGEAGPDLARSLRLTPPRFDFGEVPRFATTTTMFVLSNIGAGALEGVESLITGDTAAFMLVGNGCTEGLAPEQQCQLEVFLRANVLGPHQGQLQVRASGEQVVSAALEGTVVAPGTAP
jgi:hypothetical protein